MSGSAGQPAQWPPGQRRRCPRLCAGPRRHPLQYRLLYDPRVAPRWVGDAHLPSPSEVGRAIFIVPRRQAEPASFLAGHAVSRFNGLAARSVAGGLRPAAPAHSYDGDKRKPRHRPAGPAPRFLSASLIPVKGVLLPMPESLFEDEQFVLREAQDLVVRHVIDVWLQCRHPLAAVDRQVRR